MKFGGRYSIFYKYAVVKAADKFGEDLFFDRTNSILVKSKRILRQWRDDVAEVVLPQPKMAALNNYYGFREEWFDKQIRLAEKDMLVRRNFLRLEPSGVRSLINKFQSNKKLTSKEAKCLIQMGVLDGDGVTGLGVKYIVSGKSLKLQCEKLGLRISRVELSIQGAKVEHALLPHLSADVTTKWFYTENNFYSFILGSMLYPIFSQLGVSSPFGVFENNLEDDVIGGFTLDYFNTTLEEMTAHKLSYEDRSGGGYCDIETDYLIKIYKGVGFEFFRKMVVLEFGHGGSCNIGWPDLIGVNATGVKFIEVKKKDNLTFGQVCNFPLIVESGMELNVFVVTVLKPS